MFHSHWHLIPRREGNCEEPRGGERGVSREKQNYYLPQLTTPSSATCGGVFP
ncbi:MAG: hypothetical protein FJ083_11730, partial [Cyanobacteria bacterium K_Offshore_surface_m2_239]|nr:hypothetical protein [Cyanobacteria bacterium K_Offshore_surface_m2_239]